jgi:hypothetical protein
VQVLGMALHQSVLVEHSFATFFLQAILNRRNTLQGVLSEIAAFVDVAGSKYLSDCNNFRLAIPLH